MSCIAQHTQTLRARGYRMTPQRLAILDALHADGHLSPAEIYARVRDTGMTEATVYRTLEFLRANGVVFAAHRGDGHLTYDLAGRDHHHLVCRRCGAQMEIPSDLFRDLFSRLEQQTGYQLDAGHLTLFGLCPHCRTSL